MRLLLDEGGIVKPSAGWGAFLWGHPLGHGSTGKKRLPSTFSELSCSLRTSSFIHTFEPVISFL